MEKFLKVKIKKSEIHFKKENIFGSFNKLELALTASRRKHGSTFQILLKKMFDRAVVIDCCCFESLKIVNSEM